MRSFVKLCSVISAQESLPTSEMLGSRLNLKLSLRRLVDMRSSGARAASFFFFAAREGCDVADSEVDGRAADGEARRLRLAGGDLLRSDGEGDLRRWRLGDGERRLRAGECLRRRFGPLSRERERSLLVSRLLRCGGLGERDVSRLLRLGSGERVRGGDRL